MACNNTIPNATPHQDEFDLCLVEGVSCVSWTFHDIDDNSSKATKRRRDVKNAVGTNLHDVPLLDSKHILNGRAYCDIIIFTKHIDKWEKVICQYYDSNGSVASDPKPISNGHMITWSNGDSPVMSASFWPESQKFMLQPGDQHEKHLLKWIHDFPSLKGEVFGHMEGSEDACYNNDVHPHDNEIGSKDLCILDSTTSHEQPQSVSSSQISNTEELVVKLPPPKPYINELLCYVQNKVESCPRDTLAQICSDFYSFDVIKSAKELLSVSAAPKSNRRLVNRRGNDRCIQSMKDIIDMFLEMEVTNVPIFVARNLADIPPTSIDSMDSVKVLSEIASVKAQLGQISTGHQELLEMIRGTVAGLPSRKPLHGHADDLDSSLCDIEQTDTNMAEQDSEEEPEVLFVENPKVTVSTRVFRRTDDSKGMLKKRSYLEVASGDVARNPAVSTQRLPHQQNSQLQQRTQRHTNTSDIVIGSGAHSLKAAQSVTSYSGSRTHKDMETRQPKQCTGVFVSRLKPKTSCDNVASHVWSVAGHRVDVEKLQTRYQSYTSFYVKCSRHIRMDLLNGELWPSGALIKPFYS